MIAQDVNLRNPKMQLKIKSLTLDNPVLTASGTFGYAKEMRGVFDLSRLGGIIPKTVTLAPRAGNLPQRIVETAAGMLNSIGLDNDGIDEFLANKLPFLKQLGTKIIVSIAAKNIDECSVFAEKLEEARKNIGGIDAVEFNVSCPNVSGGVDFATDPKLCEKVVSALRRSLTLPLFVKLSPNVWNIGQVAQGAEAGGADAISAINTCFGLAVDWRRRKPKLGNGFGGLSGPAIKPIALRCVRQIYKSVKIPVIGIGGIESADDAMEFFVTGASAIQIGTANFYRPKAALEIIDALPNSLAQLGAESVSKIVGTLEM
ncbi:MAG: dihydroorotate dehydrogenase [Planctomycetaceae bacterium]|nr:dihydroorotate dehydrogenase [Planctomycetaceae bacterium]